MWMDNWVLNLPSHLWPKYGPQQQPILFRFFETQKTVVVLANSNDPAKEVHEEVCRAAKIPILRRKGGGGTVVLGPGCLVLTFAFYAEDLFGNQKYFHKINQLWIDALCQAGIQGLTQNGISDICAQDKKVAGTSIFRKKHLLVYQGSLLVDPDLETIEKALSHPSKEPEYRAGRPHHAFLTTLKALGYKGNTEELAVHCQRYFKKNIEGMLLPHSR